MTFDAGALRVTLLAMQGVRGGERAAARASVDAAGAVLRDILKQNVGLRDHSLADLAGMDHPYARRHGKISIHTKGTKAIGHPEFRVHSQSGDLLSAVRGTPTSSAAGVGYRVGLDAGAAPHAVFIVGGTRVMMPRDVVWDTADAPDVRRRMMREIVRVLGKGLRSKGGVRFGSRGGPGPGALGV